jgi:hypothetical protein
MKITTGIQHMEETSIVKKTIQSGRAKIQKH